MTYTVLKRLKEYVGETNPINLGNVCLNEVCKDHAIQLSRDQLTMHGSQGYRSCRSTHGVSVGTFYFEAVPHLPADISETEINAIKELQYRPQWRIGIVASEFETGWAVGYDAYGFSLRSVDGSLCHLRERYAKDSRLARRARRPGETLEMVIKEEDEKDEILFGEIASDKTRLYTYVEFFDLDGTDSSSKQSPFFYNPEDTIGVLLHLPDDPTLPELPKEVEIGIDRSQEKNNSKTIAKGVSPNPNSKQTSAQETSMWTSADDSGAVSRKKSAETQKDDLRPLKIGSFAAFFVDGKIRCIVHNLPHDRYYAAGSAFLYGSVEFNFGPRNAVDETFPVDWRCLPFCLTPADESRESMINTFRYYAETEQWYTSYTASMAAKGASAQRIFPPIRPVTSLYISRANEEYKDILAVFAAEEMSLDIWNNIARVYGDTVYNAIKKRPQRVQRIKQ